MWLSEEDIVYKRALNFERPFFNAPGSLGFCPDPHSMPFLSHFGAFLTNPISWRPRHPARDRAFLPFPGGYLLHTGLPNPGINRAIRQFSRCWANAPLPIIVHLLAEAPETLAEMVRKLENLENVMAVELGIPPNCDPAQLEAFTYAATGELPVILALSPEQVPTLHQTIQDLQPSAIHLCQPRGTLPDVQGVPLTGRLYGPAIFPTMLHMLEKEYSLDIPLIINGGVFHKWQADALIKAGARAVALGTVLWGAQVETLFPENVS